MKVNYQGKEYEAYALIMRKENALEILNGTKTCESRSGNKYYKMFVNDDIVAKNEKILKENPDATDLECEIKGDVNIVHFYSTGAPWTLDVEIDSLECLCLDYEEDKQRANELGFHDLDAEFDKYINSDDTYEHPFFLLHIKRVLQSRGLN